MFYIKPPKGQIDLHTLESCVFSRLEYLNLLYHGNSNKFSGNLEYMIENSIYDSVGHFTLRLLVVNSIDLWSYWIGRETLLFKHRLQCISPRHLHRLLSNILKHVNERERKTNLVDISLSQVSTFFLQREIFKHIVANDHPLKCEAFYCKLRFEVVPDLIRCRAIILKGGYGFIFCSQWKQVLCSLFETRLHQEQSRVIGLNLADKISRHPHMSVLNQRLRNLILKVVPNLSKITINNIDNEANKFPPCMRHLHKTLRDRHRLSHYARLYYSLFLKECGMNLDHAIAYWKQEYSKPHACTSTCEHNWQSGERKFLYSIRHIYGLEGSRRNYKSPTCEYLCKETVGPRYEGGCPFRCFEATALKKILSEMINGKSLEEFLKTAPVQNPEAACSLFLKLAKGRSDDRTAITNPIQYYSAMIN
ncbi:probable DNA primase large subunit [Orussus abietinus]|uniref:probable DNA primase large subunit n=1 Tax=Orussus abietinus TaxID=222816 RepID=UPI000625C631|nr:probable DNA primase large subunit [Orussus abietinus]